MQKELANLHPWNVTPAEAIEIQKELASRIVLKPLNRRIRLIAGADISFERFSNTVYAAFVVLDYQTREVVAEASIVSEAPFPYIPGLLTFREAPALLQAWLKLAEAPDVVVFDGQGISHPRRLGIGAHMGLLIRKPSIGCAKSILVGHYGELGEYPGAHSPLVHQGAIVGTALRTRLRSNPVFISPGNLIDTPSALRVMLPMCGGYRIPEPTRQAHLLVNRLRLAARPAA